MHVAYSVYKEKEIKDSKKAKTFSHSCFLAIETSLSAIIPMFSMANSINMEATRGSERRGEMEMH